jgi:hypothetical protein
MPFSSAGVFPSSLFCLGGRDLARIEKHFFFAGSRLQEDAHGRLILLGGVWPADRWPGTGWAQGGTGEEIQEDMLLCWFAGKGGEDVNCMSTDRKGRSIGNWHVGQAVG